MKALLSDLTPVVDERHEVRTPIDRVSTVATAAGGSVVATVVDLTREGCRIATGAAIAPGAFCTIEIAPLGPIRARVVWHDGEHYGCAFPTPLPPGAVTAALGGARVIPFPSRPGHAAGPHDVATLSARLKLSGRARAALLIALGAGAWLPLVAAYLLLNP